MDYKEEIEKILEESRNEIKQKTTEAIKDKIVSSLNWSLSDDISEIVNKTIKDELDTDIKNIIIDCKQEILDGIRKSFSNIGAELAKQFEQKAIQNLQNNWTCEDILNKLLK